MVENNVISQSFEFLKKEERYFLFTERVSSKNKSLPPRMMHLVSSLKSNVFFLLSSGIEGGQKAFKAPLPSFARRSFPPPRPSIPVPVLFDALRLVSIPPPALSSRREE